MRGALDKLPGIEDVAIGTDQAPFTVKYDAAKVNIDTILVALKTAGEAASVKN